MNTKKSPGRAAEPAKPVKSAAKPPKVGRYAAILAALAVKQGDR